MSSDPNNYFGFTFDEFTKLALGSLDISKGETRSMGSIEDFSRH